MNILKPNWINCSATIIFFVFGLFFGIVPAWMKITNGGVRFVFLNFNALLFLDNYAGNFNTPAHYAYWWISYIFIILELLIVYFLFSLLNYKIMKK